MYSVISEIAKYLMVLLMAGATYYNFVYFKVKTAENKNKLCNKQAMIIFLILTMAFLVMYLYTEDLQYLKLYICEILFFLIYTVIYMKIYPKSSRLILNNICLFLSIGFIMLARISLNRAVRQFIIVIISAAVTLIVPYIIHKYRNIYEKYYAYAAVGIIVLAAVLLLGITSYGAQLSFEIFGVSVQPLEFIKISFVMFCSSAFSKNVNFTHIVKVTLIAALHILILVLSRDLGSALIFFISYVLMLFISTGNYLYLISGFGSGVVASIMSYKLFSHVRVRVDVWKDPWADIYNKGYQITQSLFAIGTGGVLGMGLFGGMPNRIPVVEKDFMFAVISEELGGLFALCLILLCLGLFLQMLMISVDCKIVMYKVMVFGLGIMYIVQVFLTIGGVTKFIPLTGVTLPFISYGGSSMFSMFIIFGIIQGVVLINSKGGNNE
jgi:Bacterial cell division membrane protein